MPDFLTHNCAGWIYVRLEMMRIEYQKKEEVKKNRKHGMMGLI